MPSTSQDRIGVREFRGNFTAYMRQASEGASFLVTSHDRVVAEVRPPPVETAASRQPGALRGRIRLADDFDTLPDEFVDSMER